MDNLKQALTLCLVIGPSYCEENAFDAIIDNAIKGGATAIQLRDKKIDDSHFIHIANTLKQRLPQHILLVVNDRYHIAKELNLALHIGQSDVDYNFARNHLGKQAIIGVSIENMQQAQRFKKSDASYFGIGPVFSTTSKADAAPAIGLSLTQHIADTLSPTPCVAIGGITQTNITAFSTINNVNGIAVISAITQATSPLNATQQLLKGFL